MQAAAFHFVGLTKQCSPHRPLLLENTRSRLARASHWKPDRRLCWKVNPDSPKYPPPILVCTICDDVNAPRDIIFKSLMLFSKSDFAPLGGCQKDGDQKEETTRSEATAKTMGPLSSKSTWGKYMGGHHLEWLCTKCQGPPLRQTYSL